MNKKLFKSTLMVALVAVAGYGSYKAYEGYARNKRQSMLLTENVEALSQNTASGENQGNSFKYPEKEGDAKFCKLYIYKKGDAVVYTGEEPNSQYEAKVGIEYEKKVIEGLKDRCPDRGEGCNPYSCQEIPYTPY